MWHCYVTELHAYDFVINDFVIKMGWYLCQALYMCTFAWAVQQVWLNINQRQPETKWCIYIVFILTLHCLMLTAIHFISEKFWCNLRILPKFTVAVTAHLFLYFMASALFTVFPKKLTVHILGHIISIWKLSTVYFSQCHIYQIFIKNINKVFQKCWINNLTKF